MAERRKKVLRTPRTTLRRQPNRGTHDFDTIARILDEGFYCHMGFVVDAQPVVIPTGYGRDSHTLYIHGSAASRALRTLSGEVPLCLTVTLVDGLVLARSAFHHSINYRSVMIFGIAEEVAGDEKLRGLEVITEHMARGRWADVRLPTAQELKATSVLKLRIEEASAKIRRGPPVDEEEDYALPIWAGVIPLVSEAREPIPDARLLPEVHLPSYLAIYRRPQ